MLILSYAAILCSSETNFVLHNGMESSHVYRVEQKKPGTKKRTLWFYLCYWKGTTLSIRTNLSISVRIKGAVTFATRLVVTTEGLERGSENSHILYPDSR